MLRLPRLGELDRQPSARVYVCVKPTDMRCGFDRLAELVRAHLGQEASTGHLFVFIARRADRVKILYWDQDGFALWYRETKRGRI